LTIRLISLPVAYENVTKNYIDFNSPKINTEKYTPEHTTKKNCSRRETSGNKKLMQEQTNKKIQEKFTKCNWPPF